MDYPTIFDPVPWKEVGITFIQTFAIFWLVLIGLKLVGRRTFGELGPQDLILLLLVSEATDMGLVHNNAGFWGTLTSVFALLFTAYVVEKMPTLKTRLTPKPRPIYQDGQPHTEHMKRYSIDMDDLEKTAREYGLPITAFQDMTLEGDGKITGTLKPEYRIHHHPTPHKGSV